MFFVGKPRAVRDRKSEMISCWICVAFVAIIFVGKNLLIGFETIGVFNIVLIVLFVLWVLFAVFYTFQYKKWKKNNNM